MDYAWVAEELAAHGVPCEVSALHRAEAAARPLVSAGLERRSTETEDAFRFYLETVLHCLPGGSDMDPLQFSKISRELAPVLTSLMVAGRAGCGRLLSPESPTL